MFNQHRSLCSFALLVFFLFVVCGLWCICAASYVCGAVLRDTSAPPVSVDLLGGCWKEGKVVRFFFGLDRVRLQVKDCIAWTPALLGPALQYIVHIIPDHIAFLLWAETVAFARVLSTWLRVDLPAAL